MSDFRIDEPTLNRLNAFLSKADDVIIYNCITRTAQESKLFPLMPYLMLCFYDAYYRFPDLLREASQHITPEECGHRARQVSTLPSKLSAWGTLNFYLNGRASLIKLGLLRPEDNLEDLVFMCDWWERYSRSFHRNSGHEWTYDQNDIAPELPEHTLQVLEADAWAVDDRLRKAASRFIATGTQYLFLANCESRLTLQGSGPYRLGDNLMMHTRDFMNLGNSDYTWMDGVADDIPYNNLTLSVITRDVSIEVTDWASVYTDPEDYQDNIVGVGLYTSDFLSDRYEPVGMGSPAELSDTLEEMTALMAAATRKLYERLTQMDARQMTEAGIYVYLYAASGFSHMAGTFEHAQWEFIDQRTERLWAIHNEEYSLDSYLDNFVLMSGLQASQSDYYIHPVSYEGWRRGSAPRGPLPAPGRNAFPVPATVLIDHDYPARVNPNGLADCVGSNHLPGKSAGWLTSKGRLTQAERNRAAREMSSPLLSAPWVHQDEQWLKWHWDTPDAHAMYRYVQESSRLLRDSGAGLKRADITARRLAAGEPAWVDVPDARRERP
jgi:hypothetical protein